MANDSTHRYRERRRVLVNAAHHFLTAPCPPGQIYSRAALDAFLDSAGACALPSVDLDAVFLRCLAALDQRVAGRVASLVGRYLRSRTDPSGARDRFRGCLEKAFDVSERGDSRVHQAIALIQARYHQPTLRQAAIATEVGLTPAALAVRFKAETGHTFGDWLRHVRIMNAALLLTSSPKSVKEIWVEVGYNHASNFDHEFQKRFGTSPSEYRARSSAGGSSKPAREQRGTVFLVDDDQGTRDTVSQYLRLEGFSVVCAGGGREAVARIDGLNPSMVLLDYHLPDIDGLTCLRMLRQERATATLPVVLFTADLG
jgi:AraC-like DNA-binding protein